MSCEVYNPSKEGFYLTKNTFSTTYSKDYISITKS